MVNLRRFERAVGRILPEKTKEVVGRAYNGLRAQRADREYKPIDSDGPLSDDAPKHVILLVIDALRYDYITERTMPFFASLGPEKAVAPATWTFPSVSSLLTGRYPHEHGGMRDSNDPYSASEAEIAIPSLPSQVTTLPEMLGRYGIYSYGGFGFEMPFLALRSRFHKHRLYRDISAETLLADHRIWLLSQAERRTFSYLHLSDLHEPLDPPARYIDEFSIDTEINDLARWRYVDVTDPTPDQIRYIDNKQELYRAALRYIDDIFADYFETICGMFGSDVLVVLTSDHGEGFWEHTAFDAEHFVDSRPAYCVGHGGTPYECITRIPLWFSRNIKNINQISLVDIAPTVLSVFGLVDDIPMTGCSLISNSSKSRSLLTEACRYGYEKKAVYDGKWKLIASQGDNVIVECTTDEEPEGGPIPSNVKNSMKEEIPPWPDSDDMSDRVSRTVERRLKNLGYQ